ERLCQDIPRQASPRGRDGAAEAGGNGVSILSHDIYENIRTRTIVLHLGHILLIPADSSAEGNSTVWRLPGGGLEPHEALAECARGEVLEETGIRMALRSR